MEELRHFVNQPTLLPTPRLAATAPHEYGSANHQQVAVNAASTCHTVPRDHGTVPMRKLKAKPSITPAQHRTADTACAKQHRTGWVGPWHCTATAVTTKRLNPSSALLITKLGRHCGSNNQTAEPQLSPFDHQTRTTLWQ